MLKEQIMADMKQAMKDHDIIRKNTLTMLRAGIKQVEVDERRDLSDVDVQGIIQKQIRERQKAIAEFEKGQRIDLIDEANQEIGILNTYLPRQLSEEEIAKVVSEVLAEVGTSMGLLMKALKVRLAGQADMALVNQIVKRM